jgi:hypothetical protein
MAVARERLGRFTPYDARPPSSTPSLAAYIAGRCLFAAKVTMREYWLNNIGLGKIMRPSARSVVIAANALLRSSELAAGTS